MPVLGPITELSGSEGEEAPPMKRPPALRLPQRKDAKAKPSPVTKKPSGNLGTGEPGEVQAASPEKHPEKESTEAICYVSVIQH